MTEIQTAMLERILAVAVPREADRDFLRSCLQQVVELFPDVAVADWDIRPQKAGMTNHSYLLRLGQERFVLRVPGEGTDRLIDRAQEAAVYRAIEALDLCDEVLFMDPATGCKLSRFLPEARVADSNSDSDVRACMKRLRQFHEQGLAVEHGFDIFERIEYYETLWGGHASQYADYAQTKARVLSLRSCIDAQPKVWTLTHIDAVPDNFLFCSDGAVRLIDWEYAGMQDPHVDLAMFCIYALYERPQVERLIDAYFPEGCAPAVRRKIYCYIAACGLLWSNWCEYKRQLGVDFGEYALRQYRYAQDYYQIVAEELVNA